MTNRTRRAATLLFLSGPAVAADCLRDARPAPIGGAGVRLRHYLCDARGVGGPVVVRFDRLNDLAASLLLAGRLPEALRRDYGPIVLVENEVSAEFQRLVTTYGSLEKEAANSMLTVSSPTGGSETEGVEVPPATQVLVAGQGDDQPIDFPDPMALESVVAATTIPPGYTALARSEFKAYIWRYMKRSDLTNYATLVEAYNKLIVSGRYQRQFSGFRSGVLPAHVRLYLELSENGLPTDFITIIGDRDIKSDGCSGAKKFWEFRFHPRRLLVDFFTVQNQGTSPITIDSLAGVVKSARALRAPATALPSGTELSRIDLPRRVRLEPGQRLAIATRLTWAPPEGRSGPNPAASYAWGSEWRVGGLVISGKPQSLEGGASNYLAIQTSCACGSCPYLQVWDSKLGWRDTGKIIDKAVGHALQCSETRRFPGLVTRFRLVEQEAERARIDQVRLVLRLKSGEQIEIPAPVSALRLIDSSYVELAMGDALELRFPLPRSVRRDAVIESSITVNGYYDRYSHILLDRYGPPAAVASTTTISGDLRASV